MSSNSTFFHLLYKSLLSEDTKKRVERVILIIAVLSFLIHLGVIFLSRFNLIEFPYESSLISNPIAAIYTPFSFILIYEVYLLIYYLPKSISTYITKQYEIITLIVIRRLFKDLASLELSSDWFQIKGDLQFTYDLIAALVLFLLIWVFQVQSSKKYETRIQPKGNIERFINYKKGIAVFLVPLFFVIASYTLIDWLVDVVNSTGEMPSLKSINALFFDQFFTILILVDVVLLLLSFFYTDQFHKIIRNSGFVISTILIRLSFGVEGFMNDVTIILAVVFGVIIITIHNQYEKSQLAENNTL